MRHVISAGGALLCAVAAPALAGTPAAWGGHANSAQHSAAAPAASQSIGRIRWQTPVDLVAAAPGTELSTHYASPMITTANTVIVPVRTGGTPAWRVSAFAGATGQGVWSMTSDYVSPFSTWLPPFPAALSGTGRVFMAGAGGTILTRDKANAPSGPVGRLVFYGASVFAANTGALTQSVRVTTPITVTPGGAIFFGFEAASNNPANLVSGIARISAGGVGSWAAARDIAGDSHVTGIALNAAPALSPDGTSLYVAVTDGSAGYLVRLNSRTLKPIKRARLIDPSSGQPAWINDLSTSSPTVGPDGDVYFGVLENPFPQHNDRGWLLHFDASLQTVKTPGSFGWDDTVSIVPAAAVPQATGAAGYFLMTKYNNYIDIGTGDGHNRIAILDPAASQNDPVTPAVKVMKEVITHLGPTQDPGAPAGATYEWCINSAVVDAANSDVIANSEDGHVYRWHLPSNAITQSLRLNDPRPEPYTPTLIGPDGTIYALNNQTLYAIGN